MFLERQKILKQRQSPASMRHSTKLEDVLKHINIPQIKSHRKANNHLNTRNLLIQHTERLFKDSPKQSQRLSKKKHRESDTFSKRPGTRQSMNRSIVKRQSPDLSRREERVLAAKRYRERIGKRNDITPWVRAQEQLDMSRRSEFMQLSHGESFSRVVLDESMQERYRDMLKQFASEVMGDKKELIKTYWLAGTANSTRTRRMSTSKNPELPVTNIEFAQTEDMKLAPQKKRQSHHRRPHMSYSSQGKRVVKGHNSLTNHEETFIEPW